VRPSWTGCWPQACRFAAAPASHWRGTCPPPNILHWHDLRRECGSRLAERGVDVLKVKELPGHATIMTTRRYFATTTEALGDAMRKAMGWKRETA
jgi:integrase